MLFHAERLLWAGQRLRRLDAHLWLGTPPPGAHMLFHAERLLWAASAPSAGLDGSLVGYAAARSAHVIPRREAALGRQCLPPAWTAHLWVGARRPGAHMLFHAERLLWAMPVPSAGLDGSLVGWGTPARSAHVVPGSKEPATNLSCTSHAI